MAQQENELTEPFVQWIESEMARRDWNQAELGRQAKLRPDVISRMISRETAPEPETIKAIAGAFGLSLPQMQIAVADMLRDGQQKRGDAVRERGAARYEIHEPPSESSAEDEFLAYRLQALRTLGIAERDRLAAGVQLSMLEEFEAMGVERFGEAARAFIARHRERIRRGEPLGPDGATQS